MTAHAIAALEAVEQWWLMQADQSAGAPACIFMVREVLAAHKRTALPEAVRPVAWMHECLKPGDCDISAVNGVIHDEVKRLWLEVNPKHVEHYTVPLYRAIDPTRDAARQLRKALGLSQDFDDLPLEKLMQKAVERIATEIKHGRDNRD